MTDKELRHLRRNELLQMMIALTKENQQLRDRLKDAEKRLESREITIRESGSLAEAALQLNGVFAAAQAAAAQYLENIRLQDEKRNEISAQIEQEASRRADAIVEKANAYSARVHQSADEYYRQICEKVEKIISDQDELVELILADERKKIHEGKQGGGGPSKSGTA